MNLGFVGANSFARMMNRVRMNSHLQAFPSLFPPSFFRALIMCGIVGAVAQRNVVPILLEGLQRLEYRGYDSAGLVVVRDGQFERMRSTGRVAELKQKCAATQGMTGIAHTRWATHGVPSERNAHPHISGNRVTVVHNGIIENYEELRTLLTAAGCEFTSDTDSEVIAHLIHSHYARGNSLLAATQAALAELVGAYAIAVMAADNPAQLVCARRGSPLLLGWVKASIWWRRMSRHCCR